MQKIKQLLSKLYKIVGCQMKTQFRLIISLRQTMTKLRICIIGQIVKTVVLYVLFPIKHRLRQISKHKGNNF